MSIARTVGILTIALVAGCSSGLPQSSSGAVATAGTATPTTRPLPTLAPTPTRDPAIARVLEVGEPVFGIASAGQTVWIEGNNRLIQIDGATGEELQEVPGWWPTVRGTTLWYLRDDELVRADARTGEEIDAFRPGALGTAVEDGVLWADREEDGTLVAIDLATGRQLHELDLPPGEAKWEEPWKGAIWVPIDGSGGVMLRIDPQTGKVLDELDAGIRPHSIAVGFGSLWLTDHGSARVFRFGSDGALEASITGPGMNVGITAGEDAVWAAGPSGVHRIDPSTNAVTRTIELGHGDWYGMASSGRFVWLTGADSGRVYQIDPSR